MTEPLLYHSTRGAHPAVRIDEAIAAGLAADGGLYVPEALPRLDASAFDPQGNLANTATTLLTPFFANSSLAAALPSICAQAFDFDAPLRALPRRPDAAVLELFHGPSAAFKDFGARFLAACFQQLQRVPGPSAQAQPLTILVATSGDTGAAVAAAFHRQPGVRVVILYPDGRVSPRQAHQLGCFGDNVQALRVDGSFDDCQRMAKAALNDASLQAQLPLSSANSISLGRLLPQMSYYAHASLKIWRQHQRAPNFIIPTGNLGNALACLWVREIGLPIGRIKFACNANTTLPDFFSGADYTPRPAIATLANAMDVGAPSNFERLRWTLPHEDELRAALQAHSVDDATIRATLVQHANQGDALFCPHTATAMHLLDLEPIDGEPWVVVATAHPAKFETVLQPLLGYAPPIPAALDAMLQRSASAEPLAASEDALRAWLLRSIPALPLRREKASVA